MEKPAVTHATFVIERSYPVTPERVFAAFADPVKKRHWFRGSSESVEFEMDFRVGGKEHSSAVMGPDTPFPGVAMVNHTTYQDIVPNRRIIFAYTMTLGEQRISASLTTIELVATEKGTALHFTEQAAFLEVSDGAEIRQQGWRDLLERLAGELAR